MTAAIRKTTKSLDPSKLGRIGDRLRDAGKLTDQDIHRIVVAQAEGKLLFGEAAVQLNLVTPQEVQMVLSEQYKYPYFQSQDAGWDPELFAANDPFGAQSEAVRTLRSVLVLRGFGEDKKVVAVTCSRAGEGASSLAANLAISFAQLGQRTLLIDSDMRNPRQHLLFGLQGGSGLSSVLSGRCSTNDALVTLLPFDNLTILCAGAIPPNPQELLSQLAFSYLLETAPSAFDIVIVDTPPILEYADAQLIANHAGACLYVTRRDKTTLADIAQAKLQLGRTRTEIIGAVAWA